MTNKLRFLEHVNFTMEERGRPPGYIEAMVEAARRITKDTDPGPVAAAFIRQLYKEPLQPGDRKALGLPEI